MAARKHQVSNSKSQASAIQNLGVVLRIRLETARCTWAAGLSHTNPTRQRGALGRAKCQSPEPLAHAF